MSKLKNISGFPEWLPQHKLLESDLVRAISALYESYGFTPLETPAVELKSTLSSKGVIDKEIYLLKRASAEDLEKDDEELALHFDLTVPFARYVAQHYNDIVFPFKRYQLQKVWRGERPQRGRFREFYQFDVDSIARDTLPIAADSEIVSVLARACKLLPVGNIKCKVNNRKLLLGYYESLGLSVDLQKAVLIAVDKLDKIDSQGVETELKKISISSAQVTKIMEAIPISCKKDDFAIALATVKCSHPFFEAGIREMAELLHLMDSQDIIFDFSLARGLDYYTGTIFEFQLEDHPEYGSICSGGRYENLAGDFINKKLPGVGGSIGLSRVMDLIVKKNLISATRSAPTQLLFAVYNEEQRQKCNSLAQLARSCGVFTEVFLTSPKLGKQIEYADSKGIPFVAFVDSESSGIRIKDLRSKEENAITDLADWCRQRGSK